MNYESKARPITTAEELEAAIAAGAELELTAYGPASSDPDTYDMPRHFEPGSGGWIRFLVEADVNWVRRMISEGGHGFLFRAFYPVRPSLLSRLAFWRTTA